MSRHKRTWKLTWTETETEEKDAQAAHETIMKDSTEKRTKDSKLLGEKEPTKNGFGT